MGQQGFLQKLESHTFRSQAVPFPSSRERQPLDGAALLRESGKEYMVTLSF